MADINHNIMAKRATKQEFTVEQICDGLLYANYEPSELPEAAEDLIGDQLDENEKRYWETVQKFWTDLKTSARPNDVRKLLDMIEGGRALVEKGLRRQTAGKAYGDDSTESSGSESSEEERAPVKKAPVKKEKAESPKKDKSRKPAAKPAAAPAPAPAAADLAGGAKKKKAQAATK